MSRRLPPLNALRAFEAAARHLSFTKAAEELFVTPAAVSQQVKALEEYFGVSLFRRMTRALLLTDAGQAALPPLREGFDRLEEAAGRLRRHEAGGSLTVSVAPTFAAKWLVPRLDRFHAAHPDIDIRIDATNQVVDLTRGEVDLAVRYGPGGYSGMREDPLLGEESVAPVCSPALAAGDPPLRELRDLARHTLLHVNFGGQKSSWPTWEMWLRAAGAEGVDASRGPVFSQESMAVQAAMDGHGIALASTLFAKVDLEAGRLVQPFVLSIPLNFGYFVVAPEVTAEQPKIRAFREWLLAEAAADRETTRRAEEHAVT